MAELESNFQQHLLDLKGFGRDKSMREYIEFATSVAPSQIEALAKPARPDAAVHVICVRHGMGHHNDGFEERSREGVPRTAEIKI